MKNQIIVTSYKFISFQIDTGYNYNHFELCNVAFALNKLNLPAGVDIEIKI